MLINHSITATEAICTAIVIVIATGIAMATPLALTASYFVVMFA